MKHSSLHGPTCVGRQVWPCPFNREDLLRIWAQNDGTSLTTEDEKRAFKLLTTYNGTCPVLFLFPGRTEYVITAQELIKSGTSRVSSSLVEHALSPRLCTVVNSPQRGVSDSPTRGWKGIQMGKSPKVPDTDIDRRLRCLQRELDMVVHTRNPTMISSILHGAPQRYPTSTLRLNLEDEIDRLLREQVRHARVSGL